jgi:Tol biopolymer transport system component
MTLPAGTRLGPYQIVGPLGAGGMGEVYRARDERLKREVAVKVLPSSFSSDADRLRRFENEAQTAGGLNHPNITAVHDFGSHDGAPYIVTELLEGETLRARLAGGALPVRKATDYAIQIAHGLAAAHEKGIVHRDLKPENLFVTKDGRVKILDFGLAKLTQPEESAAGLTNLPTATGGTEPGVVLGTLGYMSPEQVKGRPADARSDIFAFGAILYEMLSGRRAFHRDSAAETMSAILREEPPELSATNRNVPPGLDRVVRHCLEKNPEERFHSAHDLAFDLAALSGVSTPAAVAAPVGRRLELRRVLPFAVAALALAAAGALGYFLGKGRGTASPPRFHQLTFRRGVIWGARFGSDGKTILYTAAWDSPAAEIYVSLAETPESRPFGLPRADLLAVASSGDLAVSLGSDADGPFTRAGTLARVGATGGAPRELLERVHFADWAPDGKEIAVVRPVAGKTRLELPPGKVLYETTGWIGDPRVDPKGDRVAFIDHPVFNDDGGSVVIVERSGGKTAISPQYATAQGLAWSPDGSEVWFSAAEVGGNRALLGATPSGRNRTLLRIPGTITLRDVARDGRVLLSHDANQTGLLALAAGEAKEKDLTWLDWSLVADISNDGRRVLFSESGEGGGPGYSVYLRNLDGAPAVRLGEGNGQAISPDGKSVLAILHPTTDQQLVIYPTGAGESRRLPTEGLRVRSARWMPDGRRIVFTAAEPGRGPRIFVGDVAGGKPRVITPERYGGVASSPDGRRILARGPDQRFYLCAVEGGEPVPLPGITLPDVALGWAADGKNIYVRRGSTSQLPSRIVLVDPETGREEKWRDLLPADAVGVSGLFGLRVAPDGKSYAYSYSRTLSTLYLVEGLK